MQIFHIFPHPPSHFGAPCHTASSSAQFAQPSQKLYSSQRYFESSCCCCYYLRGTHANGKSIYMTECIKCNHLTDRWEQFKSIPTLTAYELGNLLFCYSALSRLLFTIFSTWKTFSIGYFFCVAHHQYLLIHLTTTICAPRKLMSVQFLHCFN